VITRLGNGRSAWPAARRTLVLHRYLAATAVGLLGFVIILGLQATVNRHRIEHHLTVSAKQALLEAAYGQVSVEFSGQDAHLTAADPAQARPAGLLVAGLPGVRSAWVVSAGPTAQDGAAPATGDPAPPPVVISLKDGKITVRGSVPTDAAKASMRRALAVLGRTVDDTTLRVDAGLAETTDVSSTWMGRLTNLVTTAPDHDALVFDFTDGIPRVSGQVATEGERQAILDAASTFVPESAGATVSPDAIEIVGAH
jgi:hypothetical protein